MRSDTLEVRGATGSTGRAEPPRLFAPTHLLTLPRLDRGIQGNISYGSHDSPAMLAEALAREGIMQPSHWTGNLIGDCEKALEQWTASFKAFDLTLDVSFDMGELNLEHGYYRDAEKPGIFLLQCDELCGERCYTIKDKVLALEKRVPGAGQAVMSVLAIYTSVNVYDPRTAWGDCQWFHWRGEDNEQKYIELLRTEDCDDEADELLKRLEKMESMEQSGGEPQGESEGGLIRVTDWLREMPKWAFKPNPISPDRLKELARKAKMPKLFDPLLEIRMSDPLSDNRYIRNTVGLVTPVLLEWQPFGMVSRIYDDVYNNCIQNGDESHLTAFASTTFTYNVDSIRAAVRKLKKLLDHLAMIRQVVDQIAKSRPKDK